MKIEYICKTEHEIWNNYTKRRKNSHDLDKFYKNKLWDAAIEMELSRVRVVFQLLEDNESTPVGPTKTPYHIIFDVNFNLSRKTRLVASGHKHKDFPAYTSYASLVSRNSLGIIFLLAALNGLDILAGDIGNAYLNAPRKEKIHANL